MKCTNSTHLNQINLIKGQSLFLQQLFDGRGWTNAHDGRVDSHHSVVNQSSQWGEVVLLYCLLIG